MHETILEDGLRDHGAERSDGSPRASTAISCACMSVGKARIRRCGHVDRLGAGRPPAAPIESAAHAGCRRPSPRSLSSIESRSARVDAGQLALRLASPSPAARSVPASMRSPLTGAGRHCKRSGFTGRALRCNERVRARILRCARPSAFSEVGELASPRARTRRVRDRASSPCASAAAIIRFCVPLTADHVEDGTRPPTSRCGRGLRPCRGIELHLRAECRERPSCAGRPDARRSRSRRAPTRAPVRKRADERTEHHERRAHLADDHRTEPPVSSARPR